LQSLNGTLTIESLDMLVRHIANGDILCRIIFEQCLGVDCALKMKTFL